jgi:hypothetical protein
LLYVNRIWTLNWIQPSTMDMSDMVDRWSSRSSVLFPVSFWFDLLSQMIYIWKCLPDPGLQFIKATFEPSRQLNDLGVLVDSGKIDEWNDELPDA